MAFIRVCVAVAAIACLASGEKLFSSNFDAIPLNGKGKIKRHIDSADGHWKAEITSCPGGRGNLNDAAGIYKNCLYQELNHCDYIEGEQKCMRNELGLPMNSRNIFDFGEDLWVGQSIFIPKDYKPDDLKTIHFQLHANGGQSFAPGGPMMALQDINGQWALRISGSSDCDEFDCNFETFYVQFLAPVVPGEWYDFVYSTKLSKSWADPGYVRMWINGELVFQDENIMTAYKEAVGPHMKFGLYKHEWASERFNGHNVKVEKVAVAKAALEVRTGKNEYHKVDTAPGGRRGCKSAKDCCLSCIDGKANPLFNKFRCKQECETSSNPTAKKYCPSADAQGDCTSTGTCCSGCVNGENNPLYNPAQCTKQCRKLERSDNRDTKSFKDHCLPSNIDVCKNNNPCDASTGAKCKSDSFLQMTFTCVCPKGKIQWKNHPYKCYDPEVQRALDRLEKKVLGDYLAFKKKAKGTNEKVEKKMFNKFVNKKLRVRLEEYREVDDESDFTLGDLKDLAVKLYKASRE